MHKVKFLFLVIFLTVLSVPYLNMELSIIPDIRLEENRTVSKKPVFLLDEFYNYLDEYKNYFNDNYGFRNFLVNAFINLKYLYYKKSPLPDRVVDGKEDWLFISPEFDVTISDKIDYLSTDVFKLLEDTLLSKTRNFKKAGINYYILLTPEKSYVYNEFLPVNYNPKRIESRFDTLLSRLEKNSELNIINVNDVLKKAKVQSSEEIYMRYDAHWNGIGAFYAYSHLISQLMVDYPTLLAKQVSEYKTTKYQKPTGDLATQININQYVKNTDYLIECDDKKCTKDSVLKSEKSLHNYAFTNTYNNQKPDVLFMHDSFGATFLPWMINDFHVLHSLRMTNMDFNVNDFVQLGPKIVIHQFVPRHSTIYKSLKKGDAN